MSEVRLDLAPGGAGGMSAERRARAALSRLAEPCDAAVHRMLIEHGPVEAVERIVAGHGKLTRFASRVRALDVDRDLQTAEKVGARLLVPDDEEWPDGLADLPVEPWCLWVKGPLQLNSALRRSVAIVGARMSTAYGEQMASDLAAGLAQRGWAVVSGAAFGIDAAAHRGALAVDGPTVAVLAGGVERAYPAAHTGLIARIADCGAVVSEVAPGSAPLRSRFLLRNRLIAAMTNGTVVVEAGIRSGSLNTMGTAEALNRPIGAVPGPVTSMASAGCHEKIRAGVATLVTSVEEVIEHVGDLGTDLAQPLWGPTLPTDDLSPLDRRVHEALPYRGWATLDDVLKLSATAPMQAQAALGRLAELGLADRQDGRWRKARTPKES